MTGIKQDFPLDFWDKRILHKIGKNKIIQKMRKDLIKERQKRIMELRTDKNK